MKHNTGFYPRVQVDASPSAAVGQAGAVLLTDTVGVSGLDVALTQALAPWRKPTAVHHPAKIMLDLAVSLAVGGDCLADVAVVRGEPGLFGPVASDATVSRLVDTLPAGLALFATSTGNVAFYVAGAIVGLGYGMSIPLVPPVLINAWFVARRGLVLGIVMAGAGVGGLIWASIGPSLAQSSLGWRGVVWIMAVAMAVCTIVPALFLIRNTPADVGSVPYGAGTAQVTAGVTPGDPQALPGFTYKQALRNSSFWIACVSFLILGVVASITQVLSIVSRTAAYPNPVDKTSWTPAQVAFYSSLFMVWLSFLVIWKPALGLLNDKIGLVAMLLVSMTLMALALVYLPSMVYGSSVTLMYVAMAFLASGISNAIVTPPLVVAQATGLREFGKIFSLAVAFIYAGNAIGAPIWGLLGTSGNTKIGMYAAPLLLALFVIGCTTAVKRGKAQHTKLAETQPAQPAST